MVVYIEACEAGSLFEGMMTDDMNIYVTTAANAHESSWGTYCPGMVPSPPSEFTTCLGDLYSVSWMENRSVLGWRLTECMLPQDGPRPVHRVITCLRDMHLMS